jgi:predicted CXXCH cytochrome family protein
MRAVRDRKGNVVKICVLLFVVLWMLMGCDKYSRYRVLNLFFDGVPHPDEPPKKEVSAPVKTAKAEQQEKTNLPSAPTKYIHPAAEGKDDCSFCHGSMKNVVMPPRDICLKCHEHLKENRPFIHEPAAADCMACHNPHESSTKTLLTKTGNPLCFDCHSRQDVEKAEVHGGLKADELCLSCHDPHGGKDRFLLR